MIQISMPTPVDLYTWANNLPWYYSIPVWIAMAWFFYYIMTHIYASRGTNG